MLYIHIPNVVGHIHLPAYGRGCVEKRTVLLVGSNTYICTYLHVHSNDYVPTYDQVKIQIHGGEGS